MSQLYGAPTSKISSLSVSLTQRRTNILIDHSSSILLRAGPSCCFFLFLFLWLFGSEEIVRGRRRWAARASWWGLAAANAVVRAEELLVSSLVGVSLPQHSSQLTLQLLQLRTDGRTDGQTGRQRKHCYTTVHKKGMRQNSIWISKPEPP